MNRSARKIALLTAVSGPIFKGKSSYSTLEKQCQYLRDNMPNETSTPITLTPEVIRRWRREGVTHTKSTDNLHKFCAAVCFLLPLKKTADQIALSIADESISEYEFAKEIGLEKIQASYMLAQYDSARGAFFPHRTLLHNTSTVGNDKKDPGASGIYIIQRIEDDDHGDSYKGSIPECVLVIDRYIDRYIENEREPLGYIFVKMFVPRLDASTKLAEYSGMLLQPRNHKYFFLQSDDDYQDFVTIITDAAEYPVHLLKGIYTSVNIEGDPNPAYRQVTIRKVDTDVTDELIEQHINRLRR